MKRKLLYVLPLIPVVTIMYEKTCLNNDNKMNFTHIAVRQNQIVTVINEFVKLKKFASNIFSFKWHENQYEHIKSNFFKDFYVKTLKVGEHILRHFLNTFHLIDYLKPYFKEGLRQQKLGRYDEAILLYDNSICLKNNCFESYNNKGVCLGNLGKYEEAIMSYDKAISLKNDFYEAYLNKGNILYTLGEYEEAIQLYDKVIELKNDYFMAYYKKGNVLSTLGNYEEAIQAYKKAISLKKNYHQAYNKLGFAYECKGDYGDALKSYESALEINSLDANVKNNKQNLLNILNVIVKKTNKNEYDIFISYSWKQRQQADKLYNLLTKEGFKCWIDTNEIGTGERLYNVLMNGVLNSKVILFCLSRDYLESENCFREFHFSIREKDKNSLVPLIFGKRKELPRHHKVFFALSDAVYNESIYPLLCNKNTSSESIEWKKFIKDLNKKIY